MSARLSIVVLILVASFVPASSASAKQLPDLSVTNPSVVEGNAGQAALVFRVVADTPGTRKITFTYHTYNGATPDYDAIAGQDYLSTSGTAVIPAGQTSATVSVPVLGDTLDENDELVGFLIDSVAGGTARYPGAGGTILDDDAEPVVTVSSATVTEGNSGTTPVNFTVSLSAASGRVVQVGIVPVDHEGDAVAGWDFSEAGSSFIFQPGEIVKTGTVDVFGDTLGERDEHFGLRIAAGNAVAGPDGVVTIINDDGPPPSSIPMIIFLLNDTYTEGLPIDFRVALDRPADRAVSVGYRTVDGTADSSNYQPTAGVLAFGSGEAWKTIRVETGEDFACKPEAFIYFTVELFAPVGGTLVPGRDSARGEMFQDGIC